VTPLPKIGKPATSALAALGITTLEGAAALGEKKLLALHGFGPRAMQILREALVAQGKVLKP
jgi:predicted flap endonuclease-1-like 5' DNA nuclease